MLTNSTCSEALTCSDCSSAAGNCVWCNSNGICDTASAVKSYCNTADQETSCDGSYYETVFVIVICALILLCCIIYLKGVHGGRNGRRRTVDMLPASAREYIYRNSLRGGKSTEWMCIICGFDNKSSQSKCTMCGTNHQFSLDYKKGKLERSIEQEREKVLSNSNGSRSVVQFDLEEEEEEEEEEGSGQRSGAPERVDLGDEEASRVSVSSVVSADLVVTMESVSPLRVSFTAKEREDAFNYRRLNQLSLRQKSARRRRMWQRVPDGPGGDLKWVRRAPTQTKVGNSYFGYTPTGSVHSIVSDSEHRSASYGSEGGGEEAEPQTEAPCCCGLCCYRSATHNTGETDARNPLQEALLDAAEEGHLSSPRRRRLIGRRNRGSTSPIAINKVHRHSMERPSADSFGDSVLVSSSPGFTSQFDTDAGELRWQRVEDGMPADRSAFAALAHGSLALTEEQDSAGAGAGEGSTDHAQMTEALLKELEEEDLVAVAAYTFMEKQLWFLNKLDKLQVPYSVGCVRMEIRRAQCLLDTLVLVGGLNSFDMHKWWRVQFANEAGLDAGGLQREWFGLVVEGLFDPSTGLLTSPSGDGNSGVYHISPTSGDAQPDHLRYFRLAGRILGKALMEQHTVGASLSLPLRKQILNLPITFSDLEFVDPALYRSLLYVKTCAPNDVGALDLDFTVAYPLSRGGVRTYELKPGGADIAVTAENREEYLQLVLSNRMLTSIESQVQWLLRGFYEIVPPDLLSVFDYQELDLLLCGLPEIDVEDWRSHTEYLGVYSSKHRNIHYFWNFVEECDAEDRARLLQFITGASRLPPQGFKALISNDGNHRRFNIQSISKRESMYPRSHTCFNKLDLPVYSSQQEMNAYMSVCLGEVYGFTME